MVIFNRIQCQMLWYARSVVSTKQCVLHGGGTICCFSTCLINTSHSVPVYKRELPSTYTYDKVAILDLGATQSNSGKLGLHNNTECTLEVYHIQGRLRIYKTLWAAFSVTFPGVTPSMIGL